MCFRGVEVEEGGDVFDRSRFEMHQVEDAEFVRQNTLLILQLLIALITRSVVNVCANLQGFPLGLSCY